MSQSQSQNRRYYLHQKLKGLAEIEPKVRRVNITEEVVDLATCRQLSYLRELQDKFNYALQYTIP